ncbi:hypothetical protein OUZ56_030534 [Daphnia magna]|uniref:Uncharacterized protein n=1 Tax=Daphnia magna TaxID=35525 RepID=A0ABQ9ZRL7_9CRUS|nr:hypothetical protein OUZ56_030534 [Daphnia magna]
MVDQPWGRTAPPVPTTKKKRGSKMGGSQRVNLQHTLYNNTKQNNTKNTRLHDDSDEAKTGEIQDDATNRRDGEARKRQGEDDQVKGGEAKTTRLKAVRQRRPA